MIRSLKLKQDSRDKIFHQYFGQVVEFPDEINFDSPLTDDIQPLGDVKCTCYTTCGIAEDQENAVFDINDLWKRIKSTQYGADPRDVLGEAVAHGLLVEGASTRRQDWKSYWRADIGPKDAFDNIRSSLLIAQSPIGVATYWYQEWAKVDNTGVLPVGQTALSGHMYQVEGWKQINGEPHLIIDAWIGRKLYMPRAVLNAALKPLGMQSWVLSTAAIDAKRSKSLLEWIKDLMANLIIKLRDSISTYNVEPVVPAPVVEIPEPVHNSQIIPWAKAIETYEGAVEWRNNPGAIRGNNGAFLVFPTYQAGFNYLCDYLTRAATGKHPAYPKGGETTLIEFQNIYSPTTDNNNPHVYALFIANRLGITIDTPIKSLV